MKAPDMKVIVYHIDLDPLERKSSCEFVTREDFEKLKELVMSAKAQIDSINATIAEIGTALDRQQTALAGVTQDNDTNSKLIAQLQASQGPWSAEDQAALDKLQSNVEATKARLVAITEGLEAVDALVPAPVNPNA